MKRDREDSDDEQLQSSRVRLGGDSGLNDTSDASNLDESDQNRDFTKPSGKKHREKTTFTIAWICALPKEAIPAVLLLDEEYEPLYVPEDDNSYYFGRMDRHKIVIATLPKGSYGEISSAGVAHNIARSFPSIRLCLLVGIGAGIPSEENDIRLGDVVISIPSGNLGGVVQFDFGTEYADRPFQLKGSLNKPPDALAAATSSFEINDQMGKSKIPQLLAQAQKKMVKNPSRYRYPGVEKDHLFPPNYPCKSEGRTCRDCDKNQVDLRRSGYRSCVDPIIHYGIIASGSKLMRNPLLRDELMEKYGAKCIEMEAAGIMNKLPCLVIRGICDYADSHKNDFWQDYAALAASACARELLGFVSPILYKKTSEE
ncbi:purine and uridine phosphorylase [Hyaloscypha bicolor E]|uniref:Purine and uridine phosphorylase n=1 Tax=Hyaloscypha bicolor E TaxID=1095630 RepID=A0A2J6SKI3_9HELO|nr:purine and uridine phosphorylase [Hyaloscypha bicolor E]PMD51264.1 purine and uridine phosphorylase [Hyaloscypha bicolor E]